MGLTIIFYDRLTIVFGVAAIVFLVATVILYVVYGMKAIIRKRLGLTQKQALRRMRRQAEEAEQASHKKLHGLMFTEAERPHTRSRHREVTGHKEETAPVRAESILETLEREQEMARKKKEDRLAYAYDSETVVLGADVQTVMLGAGGQTDVSEADAETMMLGAGGQIDVSEADAETMMLGADGETDVLGADGQTAMLDADGQTDVLGADGQQAALVYRDMEEAAQTSVLGAQNIADGTSDTADDAGTVPEQFTLLRHIMMIHTDEMIA